MGLFDFLKKQNKKHETEHKKSSIFSGYRFLATLSTKTCLACGALDGKVFDTPEMPNVCLNENCRCIMLPVVKGMEGFDDDDTRASEDGPVPASWTYEKWLKKQPAKIKWEILGDYYERYKAGATLQDLAELIKSTTNIK